MAGSVSRRGVAVALALAAAGALLTGTRAGAAPTINVYVNGEKVSYYSQILDESIPALLVDDVSMVSLRFLSEYFNQPLDLHLMKYGIVTVGGVSFKLGVPEALRRVPAIGGDPAEGIALPSSPCTVGGRIYVPAVPSLRWVAGSQVSRVQWDAKERALRITRK